MVSQKKYTPVLDFYFDQSMNVIQRLPNDGRINKEKLLDALQQHSKSFDNPNTQRFFKALNSLPEINANLDLGDDESVGVRFDVPISIEAQLKTLIPWRKGPFRFGGTSIVSEWRSNLKWDRFKSHYDQLLNARVLDIGCGNGYYMYRMLSHSPEFILGVDPSHLTFMQFYMAQHFIQDSIVNYLPIGWNDLDGFNNFFDVVFCMGVMYHHRSPVDLFKMIRQISRPSMTLFFDTLIIDGDDDYILFPKDRYAKMPNVYFLPTVSALKNIMGRAGIKSIDVLSIDQTSMDEQRSTPWTFEKSLVDFLDPTDFSKTVEGYPAPKRISIVARLK
ncbi:MAG: tRNA 5-methoxyuridine(34)/uridine 5-oxyacetic acid(34) synthase CmoB [Candidatus Margulisiibacteriota bacterium]